MTSPMHSPLQSPLQPVMRSPLEFRRRGGGFDPVSALFGSGQQGVLYDPSVMSSLFQDSAGTIPVTASGQSVGKMLDLSGNGNHLTQSEASSRPILVEPSAGLWALRFDGVNDKAATSVIDYSVSDKVSAWAGITKNSDAVQQVVYSLGGIGTAGSIESLAPTGTGSTNIGMYADSSYTPSVKSIAAPATGVITQEVDLAAHTNTGQYNGVSLNTISGLTGSTIASAYLSIGSRDSALYFNGDIYTVAIVGALYDSDTVDKMNAWAAVKTGVTF